MKEGPFSSRRCQFRPSLTLHSLQPGLLCSIQLMRKLSVEFGTDAPTTVQTTRGANRECCAARAQWCALCCRWQGGGHSGHSIFEAEAIGARWQGEGTVPWVMGQRALSGKKGYAVG